MVAERSFNLMMDTNVSINKIEFLTEHNYTIWVLKMSAILRSKKLFKTVIMEPEPEKGEIGSSLRKNWEKWEERNDEAFGLIIITLSSEIAGMFIDETKAKRVWDELRRMFAGNEEDRRIDAMIEIKNLKKDINESVDSYIIKARSLVTKCRTFGQGITEREIVYYVIRGLDSSLDSIASVLRPQRGLKLEDVHIAIKEEEVRINNNYSVSNNKSRSLSEKAFNIRDKDNVTDKRKRQKCFICGKLGHFARKCWHNKNNQDRNTNHTGNQDRNTSQAGKSVAQKTLDKSYRNKGDQARVAEDKEEEFVLKSVEEVYDEDCEKNYEWSLDSGCTSHMSPRRDWMDDFVEMNSVVNLAEEGRSIKVEGKGKLKLCSILENGDIKNTNIEEVLYVPKLKGNLLSVRSLVNKGNKVIFEKGKATIYNKDIVIAQANEKGKMFVVELFSKQNKDSDDKCQIVRDNMGELWHRRLGHVNEVYLSQMINHNMVRGITSKDGNFGFCKSCSLGKMTQKPFHKIILENLTHPLELIHMDLCGPMQDSSLGGARYIFTLVDGYSRRIFVYFLERKNETLKYFKLFKQKRELETEEKIKRIRTDNGGEFINQDFEDFLNIEGIKHEKTVIYTPQSNGIAERANRIILDKTRTLLIDSQLPICFWGEAAATAVYIQNCLPSKKNGYLTPLEKWNNKTPNVSHVRIFGCLAFYFIPKHLRQKLDPKSKPGIFLGYSQCRKAYRIYDPEDEKIHESGSVDFNENEVGSKLLKEKFDREMIDRMEYKKQEEEIEVDVEEVKEISKLGRKKGTTKEEMEWRRQEEHKEREQYLREQNTRKSDRLKNRYEVNIADETKLDKIDTPKNFDDIKQTKDPEGWFEAMNKEMDLLQSHKVWTLVPREDAKKIIKSKWVYVTKENSDGSKGRKKARLVAAGHNQKLGIDFEESFSPVIKLESLRMLIAISNHLKLKMRSYDIQTAYLHGKLENNIFMEQAEGYVIKGRENDVCKLEKSIYGLPQSGRIWNQTIDKSLKKAGLNRLESDPCVYIKRENEKIIIFGLYVDDQLVMGTDDEIIDKTLNTLKEEYIMTENFKVDKFLGIQIKEDGLNKIITQENYIEEVLRKFQLENCKPVKTPSDTNQKLTEHEESTPVDVKKFQELIGSLMYISNGSRPDIAYAVSKLSQFLREPKLIHLTAAKRVYRYLKGTKDKGLIYDGNMGKLNASSDASWCSTVDAKSFSGYIVKIGSSTISWKCKKQRLVTLSTCEAELIAISEVIKEIKWMMNFLSELDMKEYIELPIKIKTDSVSAMDWIKATGQASRTKHISRKYFFVRDEYRKGNIDFEYCCSEEMEADFLTKDLSNSKITKCNESVNNITMNNQIQFKNNGGD